MEWKPNKKETEEEKTEEYGTISKGVVQLWNFERSEVVRLRIFFLYFMFTTQPKPSRVSIQF